MLTKKHFIKTAESYSRIPESPEKTQAINILVDNYSSINPRFKPETFRKACLFTGTIDMLEKCLRLE